MSRVAAAIPTAIQGASAPAVNSGLKSSDDTVLPNPPVTTATISTTEAINRASVARLIGARASLRSVRYQCPRKSPSKLAPRNAAPASSWNSATM